VPSAAPPRAILPTAILSIVPVQQVGHGPTLYSDHALTVPGYKQPVIEQRPPVQAPLQSIVTARSSTLTPQDVQSTNIRHHNRMSIAPVPTSRVVTPPFILMYEGTGGPCGHKVRGLDISKDIQGRWDALLYSALTPSAYELVRKEFVLRLWRRPVWIHERVSFKVVRLAEAKLRAIVERIVEGDVLWLFSAEEYTKKVPRRERLG
jgi:hypothetical protein